MVFVNRFVYFRRYLGNEQLLPWYVVTVVMQKNIIWNFNVIVTVYFCYHKIYCIISYYNS